MILASMILCYLASCQALKMYRWRRKVNRLNAGLKRLLAVVVFDEWANQREWQGD